MDPHFKNPYTAPHTEHGPLKPDLTRLPPHMREAIRRADPHRANEAVAHLLTGTQPISMPATRLRVSLPAEGDDVPALIALYAVDPSGTVRLAQLFLDPAQAVVLRDAIDAVLADPRVAATKVG